MVTTKPMSSRAEEGMPVLRLPAEAHATIVVQSETIIWVHTHWIKSQVWCSGEMCIACHDQAPRSKGFFIATVKGSRGMLPMLIEIVPRAWDRLGDQLSMEKEEWKPGTTLRAHREAKNKPLMLDLETGEGVVRGDLTSGHRLLGAAAVLAKMPSPKEGEGHDDYSARVASHAALIIARQMA